MEETIDGMLNTLKAHVSMLEDKIKNNNLDLSNTLDFIETIQDEDEKARIIYILNRLKRKAEYYSNKIQGRI